MTLTRALLQGLRGLRRSSDEGFAMLTVIGTMTVLSLLVAVATVSATSSVPAARADQDHHAALAAAEAGVDDYLARLNLDDAYYLKGNSDPGNPALSATTFLPVPGSTTGAAMRYQVLTAPAAITTSGSLTLEAVGRSRGVVRRLQVLITKSSFLDYMYFTDFETLDPHNTGDPAGNAGCGQYAWAGRAASCSPVVWTSADVLNGPVHSNDSLLMNGTPDFNAEVDTGWNDPARAFWSAYTGVGAVASAPQFEPDSPSYRFLPMPATNARLRQQAALGNGCIYTGPTRIVLNSGGTMTVTSPFTTAVSYDCGIFNAGNNYAATVPVPTNGVVYVDPATVDCSQAAIDTQWKKVGYPIAGDTSQNFVTPLLGYACTNGDAFVEGALAGRLTIGTANNIIITHNLTYAGSNDVLGLAASNFVQVYRPVTCGTGASDRETNTYRCLNGTDVPVTGRYPWVNPVVKAAILSTAHSVFVQNWRLSGMSTNPTSARNLGTLNITGAIAQKFRGPVSFNPGVSSDPSNKCQGFCGYAKNYVYDSRLKYAPPPYLADLTTTRWGVQRFTEPRS